MGCGSSIPISGAYERLPLNALPAKRSDSSQCRRGEAAHPLHADPPPLYSFGIIVDKLVECSSDVVSHDWEAGQPQKKGAGALVAEGKSSSRTSQVSEKKQRSSSKLSLRGHRKTVSIRLQKAKVDILSVGTGIGEARKTGLNLICIFGGPNSNKGEVIHHLHKVLGIECVSLQSVLIEHLTAQTDPGTLNAVLEDAMALTEPLDMNLALSLLADKIREKQQQYLDMQQALRSDQNGEHSSCRMLNPNLVGHQFAPLLLVDLIPNFRFLQSTSIFKNSINVFRRFNRAEFQFRFAICCQGDKIVSGKLKGKKSNSKLKVQDGIDDGQRFQKRSVLHSNSTYPFVKFFEGSNSVVKVNTTLLHHGDFLQPLAEWMAQYCDRGNHLVIAQTRLSHMARKAHARSQRLVPFNLQQQVLREGKQGETDSAQLTADGSCMTNQPLFYGGTDPVSPVVLVFGKAGPKLAALGRELLDVDAVPMTHVESVSACVDAALQIFRCKDANIAFFDFAADALPAEKLKRRRLRCPRTSVVSLGTKRIVGAHAEDLHIYEVAAPPTLPHMASGARPLMALFLSETWDAEVAVVEALEALWNKQSNSTASLWRSSDNSVAQNLDNSE